LRVVWLYNLTIIGVRGVVVKVVNPPTNTLVCRVIVMVVGSRSMMKLVTLSPYQSRFRGFV